MRKILRQSGLRLALKGCWILACLLAGVLAVPRASAQTLSTVITNNSNFTPGIVEPHSLVANIDGTIYFTDGGGIFGLGDSAHRVVAFSPATGLLSILAGDFNGRSGTNDGTGGITAKFFNPAGIILARGGLVVADSGNHTIRYVGFDGVVTNIAGAVTQAAFVNDTGSAARFNTPLGLTVDSAGNIYVADSKNNVVRKIDTANVVTTYATGFLQPNDVVAGDNGEIWVADTLNHQIKAILANGTVVLRAGEGTAGFADAFPDASNALLSSPRGLFFMGAAGLLISDSGNHVVRRLYTNSTTMTYTIETSVGGAGEAGLVNGETTSARLNSPVGITTDTLNGAFLVADSANRALRRIQQTAALPPVTTPRVGYVVLEVDTLGNLTTRLIDVVHSVFNNTVPIQFVTENGVNTYFTFADTPTNAFIDTVPDPNAGSSQATTFLEGGTTLPGSVIQNVLPDMTIKVQSSQAGRVASPIVSARFQFTVGNPQVAGDNAAAFTLNNITTNAQMFYTIDGSEPTNAAPSLGPIGPGSALSFNISGSNLLFKAKAFNTGFEPSTTISNLFSATDFTANRISFGFDSGTASSSFKAASGSTFYAPVTLTFVDGAQGIMSLQFNLQVTNAPGTTPVAAGDINFESALIQVFVDGSQASILPRSFAGFTNIVFTNAMGTPTFTNQEPTFTDLLITNFSLNSLSVGYLEIRLQTNLFDTRFQFLNSFSLAHDKLFSLANDSKAVVGGFSFVVPAAANNGDEYQIQISRPSATVDGVNTDRFIDAPTNGSLTAASPINAIKTVTIASPQYMVGDVAPFGWWNAGDFGDTNLLNVDVLSIFRAAVYNLNRPLLNSDFEDAMNVCCGTATVDPATGHLVSDGGTISTNLLGTGNDVLINSAVFGDFSGGAALLDVADVFVIFRRSLSSSLSNYTRFRSNGLHYAIASPNLFRGSSLAGVPGGAGAVGSTRQVSSVVASASVERRVRFSADSIIGTAGTIVAVPVRAQVIGNDPLRVLALNFNVVPIAGTDPLLPLVTEQVQFNPVAAIGSPAISFANLPQNYAGTWLDPTVAGISGDSVIGHVVFRIPAGAGPNAAYAIIFEHVSGSSIGVDSFPVESVNGLVSLSDRSASSVGDGIPDEWRLRHFQTDSLAGNFLSAATADADGDGFLNWQEFLAGTDPNESKSALRMRSDHVPGSGIKLRWPTVAGKNYVIEYTQSLSGGGWTALSTQVAGTGLDLEITVATSGRAPRYYRVRLVD